MTDAVRFMVSEHNITEVMRLDKDGMTYNGERVDDAGEAHRLFIETMRKMNAEVRERTWSPFRDPMVVFCLGVCMGMIWAHTL